MTILTPSQREHRRQFAKRWFERQRKAQHKRKVARVLDLAGASKEQLRAAAADVWADWQARGFSSLGADSKTYGS